MCCEYDESVSDIVCVYLKIYIFFVFLALIVLHIVYFFIFTDL